MLDRRPARGFTLVTPRDDRGATATEYALLVALIAFAIITGVMLFGGSLDSFFRGLARTVRGW